MCKISIIATFYNLENYMKKCLDSLISQTLEDIEIICLNDGSTDNTANILNEYAQKDNRLKIIHKQNEGVSATRNLGLKLAKGEYILFVDGDDYIHESTCEITYKEALQSNADIVTFQLHHPYSSRNHFKISKVYYELKNIKFNFFNKISEYYQAVYGMYIYDKLYKKEIIINNNISFPIEYNFGEDSMFVIQILAKNPSIKIIDNILYYIVPRQGSLSRNKNNQFFHVQKYINDYTNFINSFFSEREDLPKLFYLLTIDKVAESYSSFLGTFYFSENGKKYKKHLEEYLNNYTIFNLKDYKKLNGYSKIKKCLFFSKFHISWLYWKILRPVGKYCIVLPYREFKTFIRGISV